MAEVKKTEAKAEVKEKVKNIVKDTPEGWYKGYDIRWLKTETSHPDHYLVAEYEALGEEK